MLSTTRKSGRLLALALTLAAAAYATPSLANEDPLLAQFVGKWIGRGTFRASINAAPEMVYCKVANRLVDGGTALEQKGRCALATHSGPVKGKITARGDGHYEGSLQSASTRGPAWIAGIGKDGRIELNAQFTDRMTRKPGEAVISLVVSDKGGYRLTSNALGVDGKPQFVASDIVFTQE